MPGVADNQAHPDRPRRPRRPGSSPRPARGGPRRSHPDRSAPTGERRTPRDRSGKAEPGGRSPGGRQARDPQSRRQAPTGRRRPDPGLDELGVGEVLPAEVLDELRETVRPHAFTDAARALADAVLALSEDAEDGGPEAAVRAARAAKRAAPRSASVREALGIALYQAGDYRAARTELAAAQRISGRQDLAAMLADIERALGRPERAVELFERVDRSRLDPDTAAELLLVAASAYGDLGQPAAGVALIRRHVRWPVELADHHLRLAYAEGALAEQAGDLPRARAAFARVVQADPDFHDAAERLERLDRS
jgi:tetratricopeptide (TPR) repeat protein